MTSLRAEGFSAEETATILTLVKARTAGTKKFGDAAKELYLTEDTVQQATRPAVARYHAQRFIAAGVGSVVDLGCGAGTDAVAFAAAGLGTVAIECDETVASYAAVNLSPYPHARALLGDALEYTPEAVAASLGAEGPPLPDRTGADTAVNPVIWGLWCDPARRELAAPKKAAAERIFDPEAFSPPFSFVLELARTGAPVGVKLGPGFAHDQLPTAADIASPTNPSPRVEAQWVEHNGSVVELVLWFNAAARPDVSRAALIFCANRSYELIGGEKAALNCTVAPGPGDLIYEPSPAIIRAHLIPELADLLDARSLDPHIAYLVARRTEDPRIDSATAAQCAPFASCYRVVAEIPVHEKQLKRWVRERGFTALTIKKRGVNIVPERLRATLLAGSRKKKGGAGVHGTLLFTRIGSGSASSRLGWLVEPVVETDPEHESQ